MLSFISPVARESLNSYDYRMHKNSREAKNYPLPLTALPEKAVLYGQEGYLPLELAAAREHMKRIRDPGSILFSSTCCRFRTMIRRRR